MSIIVIANQKGGVGKTAITVNLAHGLQKELDCKMLVVDADPSASAHKHFRRREKGDPPYVLVGGAQPDIHSRLPQLMQAGGFQHCIVDCPAGASNITRSALRIADLVIVPVQPSYCDFDAAEELTPILVSISEVHQDLKVMIVVSRKLPGNNAYSRDAKAAAEIVFKTEGVNTIVAKQEISNRAEMVRAYSDGKTIYEYGRRRGVSCNEFTNLTEEVIECLHVPAE
jgi:chromosome partitioning protein